MNIIERLKEAFQKYKKTDNSRSTGDSYKFYSLVRWRECSFSWSDQPDFIDLTQVPKCEQVVEDVMALQKTAVSTQKNFSQGMQEQVSIVQKLLNGAKSVDIQIARTESGNTFCIITRTVPDGTVQKEILGSQAQKELLEKGQINYETVHEVKIDNIGGAYLVRGHSE